jgi:peptidoglycan/xylan/chitin deacetylase (PgdA/CDA1 family)
MRLLKTVLTKGLPRRVLSGLRKRFVFLYHDVSDPGSPQYSSLYSTTVQNFKSQVELIAQQFNLVSLEEVLSGDSDRKQRLASITFDDGFLSVKDEALPYLRAKGIPFSVFVNSMAIKHNRLSNGAGASTIDYDRKVFLDERDINDLAAQGVLIGNHSSTHKVLARCDQAALREEVLENKLYLEELTGTEVKHLALPFGKREHYNAEVLDYCHSVGHEYVYTTNPTWFDLRRDERLIPRVSILNESPEELFFLINRPLLKKIDI